MSSHTASTLRRCHHHSSERFGCATQGIADGESRPKTGGTHRFVGVPGMTGPELYAQACQHDPTIRDRFLFVTGGAVDGPIRRFFEEHRKVCLTKPVAPDELRLRVARLLARVRANRSA